MRQALLSHLEPPVPGQGPPGAGAARSPAGPAAWSAAAAGGEGSLHSPHLNREQEGTVTHRRVVKDKGAGGKAPAPEPQPLPVRGSPGPEAHLPEGPGARAGSRSPQSGRERRGRPPPQPAGRPLLRRAPPALIWGRSPHPQPRQSGRARRASLTPPASHRHFLPPLPPNTNMATPCPSRRGG